MAVERIILDAYAGALSAVDPAGLVARAAKQARLPRNVAVLAIGKAAPAMVWGLVDAGLEPAGLCITTPGVQIPRVGGVTFLVGGHPVPNQASIDAGEALLAWVEAHHEVPVLVLLSGGGSACVEVPTDGLDALMQRTVAALDGGVPIDELNQTRAAHSRIKGGKLGALLPRAQTWVLQDTPTPELVASGPMGAPDLVLASCETAVQAAGQALRAHGLPHAFPERLAGDVQDAIARFLAAGAGLPSGAFLVGGGEVTVAPGAQAPPGGRCHHAALAAASRLAPGAWFAALATDGQDGTTGAAGAWVTHEDSSFEALTNFDAYRHLVARGRSIKTGVTGTNVNDLWILRVP